VTVKNHTFILGTCYIPPSSSINVYLDHSEIINWLLLKYGKNINYIIAVDYNLPKVTFNNDETGIIISVSDTNQSNVIFDIFF
jgi:hypothetical protein